MESLLRAHRGLQTETADHSWHISLDDMLSATQRLQKLGAKDAVIVASWLHDQEASSAEPHFTDVK